MQLKISADKKIYNRERKKYFYTEKFKQKRKNIGEY